MSSDSSVRHFLFQGGEEVGNKVREFLIGSLGVTENNADLVVKAGKITLSAAVLYALYRRFFAEQKNKNAMFDGPPSFPFLGHVPYMNLDCIAETTSKFANRYGRIFNFDMPNHYVGIAHPDLMRQVYSSDWKVFERDPRANKIFDELAGGLVLANNAGDEWKTARELFNPVFAPGNLGRLRPFLVAKGQQLNERVRKFAETGEPFDLQQTFQRYTFDVIGFVAFGIDFDYLVQDSSPFEHAFSYVLEHLMSRFVCPFQNYWDYISTPATKKYDKNIQFIWETIKIRLNKLRTEGVLDDDPTILAALLRSPVTKGWSDKKICIHMTTFLFAGHDTTMNALTWLFYYLHKFPKVEEKVLDELRNSRKSIEQEVLAAGGDKKKVELAVNEELEKLTYLRAVINETLRLRTSAPFVGRMLSEDHEVKWVNDEGKEEARVLNKGTQFLIAIHALHMNPNNFNDPETFNPDRFSNEEVAPESSDSQCQPQSGQRHPFSFIPFGAGPRRCIGEKLALGEVRTGLNALLPTYTFKLVDGFEPVAKQATTLRARDGLMVTAQFRKQQ